MDERTRVSLVRELHKEMVTSLVKALEASKVYRREASKLARDHGGSWTAEYRIAKRDNQDVGDALKAHAWHSANAAFCSTMISTLMNQEVQRLVSGVA